MKCGHWLNAPAICITALCATAFADEPGKPRVAAPTAAEKPDKPDKPKVLVTISKETTFITEPLRTDGYVDYVKALNDRNRKGVTPENNAVVLMWKAVGPGAIKPPQRTEYFELLGIKPLPQKGDYFTSFEQFTDNYRKELKTAGTAVDEREFAEAIKVCYSQSSALWGVKDYPILVRWLESNLKPLQLISEASTRTKFYDPVISTTSIYEAELPALQQVRAIVRALACRAVLSASKGNDAKAFEDLLTLHRLARLIASQPRLMNALHAYSSEETVCRAEQVILSRCRLSSTVWLKARSELDALPPMPTMRDVCDVGERFCFLDLVGLAARNGLQEIRNLFGREQTTPDDAKKLLDGLGAATDFSLILRNGKPWYDRLADALRMPTHKQRAEAVERLQEDLDELRATYKRKYAHAIVHNPQTATSEFVGNMTLMILFPPMTIVENPWARAETRFEITKIGFALAAYRADHEAYPVKLGDLVPKYAGEIPKDMAVDDELHYKPNGNGYILYSVGPNMADDDGKELGNVKEGEPCDDVALVVKGVPQPDRKP